MGDESSSSSHANRLRFLCSFGGRILPRPPDGHLKYVGGDTRVVVAPRSLSFSELRERVAAVCDSDVVIKYQLMPEDLDALVSVRSDEDVRHMVEEYDRLEETRSSSSSPTASGGPRFRVYLFQSTPDGHHVPAVVTRCGGGGGHLQRVNSLEQRYIDAINGVSSPRWRRDSRGGGGGVAFTVTSPGSSPGSASGENAAAAEPGGSSSERFWPMHKAHSSPNLQQLAEGGPRFHLHHHHHHQRSPQQAPYAGASGTPTARMGGGCPHCHRAVCLRPLANRRHGAHAGMRCHVDEQPCCPGDGCRGIRYP